MCVSRLVVPILLLSLSACTVTDYEKPITEMNSAIGESIEYVNRIDQEMTAVKNERLKRDVIEGRGLLETKEDTCQVGASGCGLQVIYSDEGEAASDYPVGSLLPNTQKPLGALKAYVINLKAIVDADTTSKVMASANGALGNIANLQKAISEGKETGVSDYLTPTSSAFGWLVGQYVRAAKVSALRNATRQAQPVIDGLDKFYRNQLDAVATFSVARTAADFIPKQTSFEDLAPDQISVSDIETYRRAAADLDRSLKATHVNPIAAFAKAHRALHDQLNGDGASFSDLMAAVGRLKEEAETLKAIYESFEKVAKNNQGEPE